MKLTKLFLVLGLLNFSLIAGAATPNTACIEKDKKAAPPVAQRTTTDSHGNTVDTQAWKDWKDANSSDWQVKQGWGCCEKLTLNATTNVCEDKSVADQGLQSCSDHTECTGDKGCLSWREEDMFDESRVTTEAEKAALNAKAEEFEKAREEYDELSPVGGFCFHNMQCESYKCSGMTCKENKICRLADEEDPATPVKVKCEEPFLKKDDRCNNPNEAYYNGLLGDIVVNAKGDGQCQFELVPTAEGTTTKDIPRAINLAIATTRASEWLFSTLSMSDSMNERDCVYAKDYFRDKMKAMVTKRKDIIKEFNRIYKGIEDDFAEVQGSKKDDTSPITTICGDRTTKHDVAMRKASGKDFLCYMRERNNLFLEYEKAMFEWTTEYNAIFAGYEEEIKNWGEKDKNWTMGGRGWDWKSARTCRHWIDLWLVTITPKKLKNRWINRYRAKVTGTPSEAFTKYIETIGYGGNVDRLKKWHWVLDPLSPGRDNMSVEAFVKSLRTSDIPENDFIHEPEMASSYELRGCINKINTPECARYKTYIQDLKDVASAQMQMYSHHTKRKYKSFYKNEGSSRRRLMQRYRTDATNLLNYYTASTKLRTQQNECIERVLTQLDGAEFDGGNVGITQDSTNYYQATSTDYKGADDKGKNYNKPKIKKTTRAPIKFNLGGNRNSLKDSANKDNVAKSSGGGSGSMDSAALGALAARTKGMLEQNTKAAAAGGTPKKMESDILASVAPSASGASGSAGRGGMASGAMSGYGEGKKATLGDGAAKDDMSAKDGKGIPAGAGAGMNAGAGLAAGSMAGIVGGSASGAGNPGPHQDPTGMSDEEKDVMAQNYDRNRSDYKTKEDDTLFQVLSKTYVRNLDKILTRKKKLDEDSASFPSSPSTP